MADWIDAARVARKTREQTAATRLGSDAAAEQGAARQARLTQIDRLHAAWSLAIQSYLVALGERAWGLCKYEIVDDVGPDASWREYQVKELAWHERIDRYTVRNQDDWYVCEYRLGYRLRIGLKDDHYTLGDSPLTDASLRRWFAEVFQAGAPQCVEERLVRIY